jgi:hypothetical protein
MVITLNESIHFPPPDVIPLGHSHLNNHHIDSFVLKYGGSKDKIGMSWGERQIEWIYLMMEGNDNIFMQCAKTNAEHWASEYHESRNRV